MTFDGGGVKGVLTVVLLRRLHQTFPQLFHTTDFFAGTSTGSFIALALANELSPERLVELYSEENAKYIFTPLHFDVFRPKYDNAHLKEVLLRVFPDNMRLTELVKHRVLVPSFKINAPLEGLWHPVFNNNFPNSLTQNEKVIDVALSSSAAPYYFPAYNHQIDGAVYANNPSPAAIILAVDTEVGNQNLGDVVLLSLGTGLNPVSSLPILSDLYDEVVEAASYLSYQMLGDRYFRLNPNLSTSVGLDEYEKIPQLLDLAEAVDLEPVVSWIQDHWF